MEKQKKLVSIRYAYSNELVQEDLALCSFVAQNKTVYIYGAGRYGMAVKRYISECVGHIDGVIVTKKGNDSFQAEVLEMQEAAALLDSDCGVILALREEFQYEVLAQYEDFFEKKGVNLFIPSKQYLATLWREDQDILCKRVVEWKKNFNVKTEINKTEWKKILLIQVEDAIGDTIWSSALLREMRKNFKGQHITYLVSEKMKAMICNCPYVEEIIYYPYEQENAAYSQELEKYVANFAKENLRGKGFDVVFLIKALPCHGGDALDNVILALYSEIETKIAHAFYVFDEEKFFCNLWKDLFSVIVKNESAEHDVSKDLSLMRAFGGVVDELQMEMWVGEAEEEEAASYFVNVDKEACVIALGLKGREARRNWPVENYVELMRRLNKKYEGEIYFALFGGANAEDIREELLGANVPVIDMINKTSLSVSAAAMRMCDFYIGADTSLLHMAAASGLPIIELTANLPDGEPTDQGAPERTGPWQVECEIIRPRRALDECTHLCKKGYAHCITQIAIDDVEAAAERMIQKMK